jgi:hypothetical protein
VTLQIVRDWVVKFNARGPAGLIDGEGPESVDDYETAEVLD